MVNNMAKEFILMLRAKKNMENGLMEKESVGLKIILKSL